MVYDQTWLVVGQGNQRIWNKTIHKYQTQQHHV